MHTHMLTIVLKVRCSCCCCKSRPQATHSPWQSLRPGVKRHASSTSRNQKGIFISQHSQTGRNKLAQQVEEKSLTQGSTAGVTGSLSLQDQGPAYGEKADKVTGTLPQFQFTGIISWIRAVSQSVGGGRVFSQHQEMDSVGGMERKSIT